MKTFRFKHDDSCQDYNGDDSGNLSSNATFLLGLEQKTFSCKNKPIEAPPNPRLKPGEWHRPASWSSLLKEDRRTGTSH